MSVEGEVKKNMKKIQLLIATILTSVSLSHAVDSYSQVVGYSKVTVPKGTRAVVPGFEIGRAHV